MRGGRTDVIAIQRRIAEVKDRIEQRFKEVAHSQSLHLITLQKLRRLRVLKLSQQKPFAIGLNTTSHAAPRAGACAAIKGATGPSPLGGSCFAECHALHVSGTTKRSYANVRIIPPLLRPDRKREYTIRSRGGSSSDLEVNSLAL